MDKDVVLRVNDMGQALEKAKLRLEGGVDDAAELRHVRAPAHDETGLLAHLGQQARAPARAVREQIALAVLVGGGCRAVYGVLPEVAVAQHGEDTPLRGQAHYIPERLQAVTALLEDVAAEDQRVLVPELEPGEQALQVRQVAVDVRDGDYAPGVRQLHLLDDGPHQFSLSMSSWSEATPLSVPSSLKPK